MGEMFLQQSPSSESFNHDPNVLILRLASSSWSLSIHTLGNSLQLYKFSFFHNCHFQYVLYERKISQVIIYMPVNTHHKVIQCIHILKYCFLHYSYSLIKIRDEPQFQKIYTWELSPLSVYSCQHYFKIIIYMFVVITSQGPYKKKNKNKKIELNFIIFLAIRHSNS